MEKKPVKRSPYIIKLSRDHHASLLFCWKIRQGEKLNIDNKRMKPYVSYFAEEHMMPHFKEEETILFAPALDDKFVLQALKEHEYINSLVKIIYQSSGNELSDALTKIVDSVDEHVRYEERILFPHLEKLLSEDQLKAISTQLDHEPEKDVYPDEFWRTTK